MNAVIRGRSLEVLLQVIDYDSLTKISTQESKVLYCKIASKLDVLTCEHSIAKEVLGVDEPQEVVSIFASGCCVENKLVEVAELRQE